MAVIEFVDRDIEAKKIDVKKKVNKDNKDNKDNKETKVDQKSLAKLKK